MGFYQTPPSLDSLFFGITTAWETGFKTAAPLWDKIAMKTTSTGEAERYAWLAEIPGMREWLGERVIVGLSAREAEIINKDWERTLGIPRNKVADDKIGLYKSYAEKLGRQAALWPDDMVWPTLQAGKTTICYDGQPYFSTTHPSNTDNPASPTFSNLYTGKPPSFQNIVDIRAAFGSYTHEDGRPVGYVPTKIYCPPQLEVPIKQLINSLIVGAVYGSSTAAAGVSNPLQGMFDVVMVPKLGNEPGVWYMANTDAAVMPMVFQERTPPEFIARFDPTDPNVWNRKEFQYGVDARGNAAFTLPFLMARIEST